MSRTSGMLTTAEAWYFIREVLKLSSSKESLKTDRIKFLNEYVRAWMHHIPFQTVRSLATPPDERRLPTLGEIKEDIVSEIGGRCYFMNTFTLHLVRALGFKASLVPGDCTNDKGSHLCVIVHDLSSDGSMHILDVGAGCPGFQVIPLDFENSSIVYHDSYLRFRFVREGDLVHRLHAANDYANAEDFKDHITEGWFTFCTLHVCKPVNISYFDEMLTKVYTQVLPEIPFLRSLRCFAFPHGRFVCIKDTTLLVEDEEGRVQKTYMRSPQEIVDAFARFFPQYPEEMVRAAMRDQNLSLDYTKGL